jgi:Acetyltransferase (GNAT) domain
LVGDGKADFGVRQPLAAREEVPSTGYVHDAYARVLGEFGTPRRLPRSGAWVLERTIPGSPLRDAMGCYPVLVCRDWAGLAADLGDLAGQLVSVSAITDPFGNYRPEDLAAAFPHLIAPFKEHFIVDLERHPLEAASSHHRRYARRALRNLTVERSDSPDREAGSWQRLYASLVRRHGVTGIRAFSPAALEAQLEVPGAVLFKARSDSHVVGMALWYVFGDVGYYHLGACSEAGYELRAFFGLFWRAIEYFAGAGLRTLGLGGGVGLAQSSDDGLSRFKRGWSTRTCPVYVCGRILEPAAYRELVTATGTQGTRYFPAYRQGEFR